MRHLGLFIAGAYAPIAFIGDMAWRLITSAIALFVIVGVWMGLAHLIGDGLQTLIAGYQPKEHALLGLGLAASVIVTLSGAAWILHDRLVGSPDEEPDAGRSLTAS